MGIATSIVELLKRERIPYTWFQHKLSYTAQEEAAVSQISVPTPGGGRRLKRNVSINGDSLIAAPAHVWLSAS